MLISIELTRSFLKVVLPEKKTRNYFQKGIINPESPMLLNVQFQIYRLRVVHVGCFVTYTCLLSLSGIVQNVIYYQINVFNPIGVISEETLAIITRCIGVIFKNE